MIRIKALILSFAEISVPSAVYDMTNFGKAFVPLRHESPQSNPENQGRQRLAAALSELVKEGPVAMPALLESLDDSRPTQSTVVHDVRIGENHRWGYMRFTDRLQGERLTPEFGADFVSDSSDLSSYTVTIGDMCFMALGQITSKQYVPIMASSPSCIDIRSPCHNKRLLNVVREKWSRGIPADRLLESLLADFGTALPRDGELADLHDASGVQIESAKRLLYYFAKESAPVIADRLRSLDVSNPLASGEADPELSLLLKNGVDGPGLVEAVSWCAEPAIQDALHDMAKRSDDPRIARILGPSSDTERLALIGVVAIMCIISWCIYRRAKRGRT
jgi:hypothetical protein